MKLRSLRIRNLLSFGQESQGLELQDSPISFVVGPNNSGKTNLFRTLSFVADCTASGYPPFQVAPYLPSGAREFEVVVGVELDKEELQALQDFLVCANMLYNPGGEQETQLLMRIKNEILSKYDDRLFSGLQRQITIVVKGIQRDTQQFDHFVRLKWGQDEFVLQREGYLGKQESLGTSGFGFSVFSTLLMVDFKERYPADLEKLRQGEGTFEGSS